MNSTILLIALSATLYAQPDRVLSALQDRALADQGARLKTDDRIAMYQALVEYKSDNLHYHNLLAAAFVQKTRETADYGYLDRAARILEHVLASDGGNYEALRLRSEVELERHNFAQVAEYSRRLTQIAPDDPWNWGTLGDALMEMGRYDQAADAYQKMVTLRPDQSSYNRAAWYRFVAGDLEGAIAIMQRAVSAGSASAENTAWCLVELGHLYWKGGRLADAERAYTEALRVFPRYHLGLAGLGRVQTAQGRNAAAIESYKRAQAATPWPDYAAALHDLYLKAGKPEEARRQMELIDVIDKLEQKPNRNLALILADHDRKLDRALQLAQADLAVRQDVYTYDALAWALYKNKKYAEADQAMRQALKMGTPEPQFHEHARKIAQALAREVTP